MSRLAARSGTNNKTINDRQSTELAMWLNGFATTLKAMHQKQHCHANPAITATKLPTSTIQLASFLHACHGFRNKKKQRDGNDQRGDR